VLKTLAVRCALTERMHNSMKLHKTAAEIIACALLCSVAMSANGKLPADKQSLVQPYLGSWDLTLKAPNREYPSWLQLREEDGQLKAEMVGRWGNARPLPKAELSHGHLTFVSPKEEEDRKDDMVFEGKLVGTVLSGTTTGPDGTPWTWTGRRAPALKRNHPPRWGKPIRLFDGKDLSGWRPDKPNPAAVWKVENGTLVSPGNGPELINDSKFEDFKLHIEFNCGPDSNSGIYLRGRYEVQVETNSVQEPPSHHTGAIYGFLTPHPELPRKPGEWQSFDITLVGRTVTVVQNGQTIIDKEAIPGITGGALDSHEELPGPIYLQGSEAGHVAFRNIVITPALN
jgi:3-keto-disaccharide hydrolase